MELLKKIICVSVTLMLSLTFINKGFCQNLKTASLAFSNSYTNEKFKNYQSAINDIKAVLQPDFYEAYLRLGWLYALVQKYDLAIQHYQQAAQLKPASIEPLLGLANIYIYIDQKEKAEQVYLNLLTIDAKNYTANYGLANVYYNKKNFQKAKKYFDVGLNLLPFDYGFLVMSAWNCYYLGMFNEARVLFQKTLLVAPNDNFALQGLNLIK